MERNVKIEAAEGKKIISITVPRAERSLRPIFLGKDPYEGSFRRNNEGDFRCTHEEITAMFRDNDIRTQDMKILENLPVSVLDKGSVQRYRNVFNNLHINHIWRNLADDEFLIQLGAIRLSDNNEYHPTAAGLLMFGTEIEILKEFPKYFLDYTENFSLTKAMRWTDRVISSSGDWTGNLLDFAFRTINKITQFVKTPFKIIDGLRQEDTPVHQAFREIIINALVNADYYLGTGVVIRCSANEILARNPGTIRISPKLAFAGGVSDPRNSVVMKMFNLIDLGERAGTGLLKIKYACEVENWDMPSISENKNPDFVELKLPLPENIEINVTDNLTNVTDRTDKIISLIKESGTIDNQSGMESGTIEAESGMKIKTADKILDLISKDNTISITRLSIETKITRSTIQKHIDNLRAKGIIRREGAGKGGKWVIIRQ
jgi:predicted HTH transcriptional regulator